LLAAWGETSVVDCPEKTVPPLGLIAGMVRVLQPVPTRHPKDKSPQTIANSLAAIDGWFSRAVLDRSDASIGQDHEG